MSSAPPPTERPPSADQRVALDAIRSASKSWQAILTQLATDCPERTAAVALHTESLKYAERAVTTPPPAAAN